MARRSYEEIMKDVQREFINSDVFKDAVRGIVREELSKVTVPTETKKPTTSKKGKSTATVEPKVIEYKAIDIRTDKMRVYTVTGNSGKEHSSIRIWFAEKPSTEILNKLRASAFRYFKPSKEWYAHNVESAIEVAREVYKLHK